MAGKQTDNQLLFSAVSSGFDSFPSVLAPPSETNTKNEEKNEAKSSSIDDPSVSLQPHLESASKPDQIGKPPVFSSQSKPPKTSGSLPLIGPPILPSGVAQIASNKIGGPSFRNKPNSKYVVPREIGKVEEQTSVPRFQPLSKPSGMMPDTTSALLPPSSTFMMPDPSLAPTPPQQYVPVAANADFLVSNTVPDSFDALATNPPEQNNTYYPVVHHWFFYDLKKDVSTWTPFSFTDSLNLEEAYLSDQTEPVPTDGKRYDVNVAKRKRTPLFWDTTPSDVRRCSWFHRGFSESLPIPYSEEDAKKLEEEYKDAFESQRWHRQVHLSGGETVVLNSPYVMQHYNVQDTSEFPNTVSIADAHQTPRVVRRGADDFTISDGTSDQIDHLLFLVHGVGSGCDLSFRSVEECVDDFRAIGEDLISVHFKEALDSGKIGRIEVLPISWHKALHGDETGVDAKLKLITLRSIPKLREFTNDTLLDILFFTSPSYCQHIMDTVASEMERLLKIFNKRHPQFQGNISLGGHSLGSVILFDLLMNQQEPGTTSSTESVKESLQSSAVGTNSGTAKVEFRKGVAGTGQPLINYPQLSFVPNALFMLGSPVGMFITVRGIDALGPNFRLPTCQRVFNLFHPYDPVAYRIETLIDPNRTDLRPVLIPHHKGRKRMHLELKDTIERVSSDLKNKIVESIQSTWKKVCTMYGGSDAYVKEEVSQALETDLNEMPMVPESESTEEIAIGCLNEGNRIDYVLQEKPYESFTEYIFALQAHLTYWQSEDTLLFVINKVYNELGIYSDNDMQKKRNDSNVPQPQLPVAPSTTIDPVVPLPVPLMSSESPNNAPPLPMYLPSIRAQKEPPKILGNRPVYDPSVSPATFGMDPTAQPSGASKPGPPPILPNISFKRKS